MITFSLQSGSNGNAVFVEAYGVRLLFDAGISGKQAQLRMAEHGYDIRDVTALVISHDHVDHIRCAGIYQRKFGLPICVTPTTFHSATCDLGPVEDVRHFAAGETLKFGRVKIHTVPTPHDGADGVAFVVEAGRKRLGILTDLGHPFAALPEVLSELDAVYLESNYDPGMLDTGPYPAYIKKRIRGNGGHLSNPEAAELAKPFVGKRLRWLALAHLSEINNSPEVALGTHKEVIGSSFPIHVASRYEVGPVLEV